MVTERVLSEANKQFVLRALHEKCRREKKQKGNCLYGSLDFHKGHKDVIPDEFFSAWAQRLSRQGLRQYMDALRDQGLVDFFEAADGKIFFEITEKGRDYMLQHGVADY
jgi:hypothetical protein